MKKQKDLHAELAKRKFTKPNIIPYFIYYVVGLTKLLGGQYNPTLTRIDKLPKKGPAFLIWNHQSRRDHTFLTSLAWPRKLSIVAEYNSFFREHLHWPFKMMKIIPKKVFTNDMTSMRAINTIIKKGGILCTFSCSEHMTFPLFLEMLMDASEKVKRDVRIIDMRIQSPDHPISLNMKQSLYLKCVILNVM